jgi:hypothetical protein
MMKYEDGYTDGGMSDTSATLFSIALFGAAFGIGGAIMLAVLAALR